MKNYRTTLLNLCFIFISLVLIISCGEESISQKDKRLAKGRKKEKITIADTLEQIVIYKEKVIHTKYTTEPQDSTYWYVVFKDDITNWHGTVELPTPYFDFKEAVKQFKGSKGKPYFKFILQINKESSDSYYELYDTYD